MLTFAVVVIGSYLLGSIPFGYLAGRDLRGSDIRAAVVATSVRHQRYCERSGRSYGYPVFAADFLKGFGSVKMSILIATRVQPEWNSSEMFGIRRGDIERARAFFSRVATLQGRERCRHFSQGRFSALARLRALVGVAIWILTFWLTSYVSVASIAAAAALPLIILITTWLSRNAREGCYSTRRFVSRQL